TLLRFTNDLTRELATVALPGVQPQTEAVATPVTLSEGVIFRMNFGLAAIRLSLVKEQRKFLQVSLDKALLDFDLNGDNSIAMALTLASLSVRDFYDTPWSYLLST